MHVGRVTAVYWPGHEAAAVALAEAADAATGWPGLPREWDDPVRLVLARDDDHFETLTRRRLPEWGGAAAFPGSNTIVLKLTGDVRRVLRHELAHLALHDAVRRVPLWFDEGYAARAAGEWGRLEALRVNWALLSGIAPTLRQLNTDLRGGAGRAEAAYALSTTAVLLLERLGAERGLTPLLTNLQASADFDRALRVTHHLTLGQFEAEWQRDLRRRYGWVLFLSSVTVFWAIVAVVLVSLWARRRGHDRVRRAALDEGWVIDESADDASA